MKRLFKTLVLTLSLLLLSNCVFLESVSLTNIPQNRSKRVTASVQKSIVFYTSFSNAYVDELSAKLGRQCPNGVVSGILTKTESTCYFPLFCFYVVSTVTASGVCNQ